MSTKEKTKKDNLCRFKRKWELESRNGKREIFERVGNGEILNQGEVWIVVVVVVVLFVSFQT